MASNHVQKGDVLDYLNEGEETIAVGVPIVVGDKVGVPLGNIPAGEVGRVAMSEVFSLAKAAEEIAQGKKVYLASNAKITLTSIDNVEAGYAFASAASGDATVSVKLNG